MMSAMDVAVLTARSATQVEATVSCLAALCVGSWAGEEEPRSQCTLREGSEGEVVVRSLARLRRHQAPRAEIQWEEDSRRRGEIHLAGVLLSAGGSPRGREGWAARRP